MHKYIPEGESELGPTYKKIDQFNRFLEERAKQSNFQILDARKVVIDNKGGIGLHTSVRVYNILREAFVGLMTTAYLENEAAKKPARLVVLPQ